MRHWRSISISTGMRSPVPACARHRRHGPYRLAVRPHAAGTQPLDGGGHHRGRAGARPGQGTGHAGAVHGRRRARAASGIARRCRLARPAGGLCHPHRLSDRIVVLHVPSGRDVLRDRRRHQVDAGTGATPRRGLASSTSPAWRSTAWATSSAARNTCLTRAPSATSTPARCAAATRRQARRRKPVRLIPFRIPGAGQGRPPGADLRPRHPSRRRPPVRGARTQRRGRQGLRHEDDRRKHTNVLIHRRRGVRHPHRAGRGGRTASRTTWPIPPPTRQSARWPIWCTANSVRATRTSSSTSTRTRPTRRSTTCHSTCHALRRSAERPQVGLEDMYRKLIAYMG